MSLALSLLLAAGTPTVVLTPANVHPPAPFETRCGPAAPQAGGSQVECVVEQPQVGSAARPAMRILIRTTPMDDACQVRGSEAVVLPAAQPARRAGGLPLVVEATRTQPCP